MKKHNLNVNDPVGKKVKDLNNNDNVFKKTTNKKYKIQGQLNLIRLSCSSFKR